MRPASTIVVLFDQIGREELFRRLEWPRLIAAWSGAIGWERVGETRVRLTLEGIDGLSALIVTRKRIRDTVFVGARDESGDLIQTGAWFYDDTESIAGCLRRVYRADLAETLQRRLPDFCCSTFLYDETHAPT